MDTFSKIRKTATKEEQKRQMINKAIDLLHKLANKRLDFADAKSEISKVISEYYVTHEEEGIDSSAKINLEVMMNNAFDVISGVKEEKLNLYQAIMLMNKVMARSEGAKPSKAEPKKQEKQEKKVEMPEKGLKQEKVPLPALSQEVKREKVEKKEDPSFAQLMDLVIANKKKYLDSIEELNALLKSHGLKLNMLEPK